MSEASYPYDFRRIEPKWQAFWAEHQTFRTPEPDEPGFDADRPKFYVLDMFPYPSGVGLHVGHPLGYIATDIVARYKRMTGANVLHPMGFDAFGLPAEQFAVEHGVHPRQTTEQNIENMVRQLKRIGFSYDWDRQIATTDVDYYKWTQWIFLQLYHSYFDPIEQRARPIDELVEKLQGEDYLLAYDGSLIASGIHEDMESITGGPIGARKWYELTKAEQRAVLDGQRLAYLDEVPVNWCPALGTVLANEEVTDEGRSERGNHPVYKRPLEQWMLRITAYGDRLADDLDQVDWPESIRKRQRDWIGRSEGAVVDFPIVGGEGETIQVFTTRPDTLFGATYMVLAPEHPLVAEITSDAQREAVRQYRKQAESRSEVDRMAESKTKTGVFTGAHAENPVNGERVPIWIADYVLTGYGTGAIMAVPAHDQRDFAFARQFDLPIRAVVSPPDDWLERAAADFEARRQEGAEAGARADDAAREELRNQYRGDPGQFPEAFTGEGVSMQSANDSVSLDGLATPEAKQRITKWLTQQGLGRAQVQYKLRDWLFSRQRYWGEPFPILHELDGQGSRTGRIRAVAEADLPVELPAMDDFTPEASDDPDAPPRPPLARASESWRIVEIDGVRYERELNTMPQWAGSCWYYLRFIDPENDERFVDAAKERYWMRAGEAGGAGGVDAPARSGGVDALARSRWLAQAPMGVDLYVGGVEHAVLHLLYARFWHKVLYDLGHVSTPEPFGKLFNQGYIQAAAYVDDRGVYVPAEEVEEKDGKFFHQGKEVTREFGKMGKSLKNAISPDEMADEYGADTLRLYEMYMGPLEASKPWNTRDVIGVHRFLQRLWRNFVDEQTGELTVTDAPADEARLRSLHKTIKRVGDDMQRMAFNTAIAALIELNNELTKSEGALPRDVAEPLLKMLAPFAPHFAEELWSRLGHERTIAYEPWPTHDEQYLVEQTIELPVQVMGKLRSRIEVPADADEEAVKQLALDDEKIRGQIEGKTVRKVIVVPGKLINIVAN